MARKRMIDPDFWNDEKLGSCTRDERLLFMGLISNSDDEGKGRANVRLIKSEIFPYDDDLKIKDIEKMFINLSKKNLVIVFVVDEQEFYYLPNFNKHQVINKPMPSKLPEIPNETQLPYYYGSDTVALPPKRKEVNRKEVNRNIIDDFFEKLWILYPKKEGKGQVLLSQKERLYEIGIEEMTRAVERYKKDKENVDRQFLKQGSTFFNSGYVDYLDANYTPPETYKPKTKAELREEELRREIEKTMEEEGYIEN